MVRQESQLVQAGSRPAVTYLLPQLFVAQSFIIPTKGILTKGKVIPSILLQGQPPWQLIPAQHPRGRIRPRTHSNSWTELSFKSLASWTEPNSRRHRVHLNLEPGANLVVRYRRALGPARISLIVPDLYFSLVY